jgi:hypothetical protein
MDDLAFDFEEAREEMRAAMEAGDTEEMKRIFKGVLSQRNEAKKTGEVALRMHLERLMGQWLIKLEELGLLVETH